MWLVVCLFVGIFLHFPLAMWLGWRRDGVSPFSREFWAW